MPFAVKLLVAGEGLGSYEKGAIQRVVPSTFDWGAKTVTPQWMRLVISDMTGATQLEAEENAKGYLEAWHNHFTYAIVPGGGNGRARYQVEATPEIANDFGAQAKIDLRDAILAWLQEVSGGTTTIFNQSATHVTYESIEGIPLAEIQNVLQSSVQFSRYKFPDSLVDQALATVNPGEPAEFTRTLAQVTSLVIDKLKN